MSSLIIRPTNLLQRYISKLETNRASLSKSKKRKTGMLSVVFVTWERPDHIVKTVDSFLSHMKKRESQIPLEIISVDNHSTNKQVRKILGRYKWDIAIRNSQNLGISAALHQAYDASNGEFVICLEDDWETVATKPFVKDCVQILDGYPDVGGVRLKENVQCFVSGRKKLNKKQISLEFDDEGMKSQGVPWRGKYKTRGWHDLRTTDGNFYTWTNYSNSFPNTYANSCFLFRGEALTGWEA